jgi:hypothetical protein
MAHTRTIMLRGIARRDARPTPVAVDPHPGGFGLTGGVRCKRCGATRAPFQHCRTCEIASGRRVGSYGPTENTTPTQRKERATL